MENVFVGQTNYFIIFPLLINLILVCDYSSWAEAVAVPRLMGVSLQKPSSLSKKCDVNNTVSSLLSDVETNYMLNAVSQKDCGVKL